MFANIPSPHSCKKCLANLVTSYFLKGLLFMLKQRISGVLLPIASLPAKDVGNLGKVAYQFIDQLVAAGQRIWQMLPVGSTIVHDSPFYSPSAFAMSANYIDLEDLTFTPGRFLITHEELDTYYHKFDWEKPNRIAYGLLWEQKRPLLQKAYRVFVENQGLSNPAFQKFVQSQSFWLEDYVQFMGIKEVFLGQKDKETWFLWPIEFKNRSEFNRLFQEFAQLAQRNQNIPEVKNWQITGVSGYWNTDRVQLFHQIHHYAGYHRFLQWILNEQWQKLREYAHSKNIILIGDCPIYVAPDSADVWANQAIFKLDKQGNQACYAGVPPDYFSPKHGQFWGNPIYKWWADESKQELSVATLDWWTMRLQHQLSLFDELRIDHFRGFAGYYEIPADRCEDVDETTGKKIKTAKYGAWKPGPGVKLFEYFAKKIGKNITEIPIIAEDLGVITKDVVQIREALQAPGMAIFQFGPWQHLHFLASPGNYVYLRDPEQLKALPLSTREGWERLFYRAEEKWVPFIEHEFLPENAQISGKLISYPGTHDNETLMGWFTSEDRMPVEPAILERYLDYRLGHTSNEEVNWKVIHVLSQAPEIRYAIFQMQDILGLPNVEISKDITPTPEGDHIIKIRTNIPNKEKQWQWKLPPGKFTPEIIERLRKATQAGGRI